MTANQNLHNNNNSDTVVDQAERTLRATDADLAVEATMQPPSKNVDPSSTSPTASSTAEKHPFQFVPLTMNGRTHVVSEASRTLIENEVTLNDLETMTELFYEKAFVDPTLDKFIRNHDDPHGSRFAKWIHQKLSGSNVWDLDRQSRSQTPVRLAGGHLHIVHDRSSAHAAAWYSPKRPSSQVGRHFKLDECRVWMRLHFWALRQSGLADKSPSFADYYVRFIGHFVRVYENSAQQFARDSWRWSADPSNIEAYLQNGRVMKDVLGLSLEEAEDQIPEEELNDYVWPYNQEER